MVKFCLFNSLEELWEILFLKSQSVRLRNSLKHLFTSYHIKFSALVISKIFARSCIDF